MLKATFTPTDTANYNSANAQVQIVVNPYSFTSFVQPIDMGGVFNKVKLGSEPGEVQSRRLQGNLQTTQKPPRRGEA